MDRQSNFLTIAGHKVRTTSHFGRVATVSVLLLLSGCASPIQPIKPTTVEARAPQIIVEPSAAATLDSAPEQALTQADIQQLFIQSRELVTDHSGVDLQHVDLVFASDREIGDEVLSETKRLISLVTKYYQKQNDSSPANLLTLDLLAIF